MTRAGACLCGAVRFTVRTGEVFGRCHCEMCRKWSAGAFAGVFVEEIAFEDASALGRYRSSDWAERVFCTRCGSNIAYRLMDRDVWSVAIGTLEGAEAMRLGREIYADAAILPLAPEAQQLDTAATRALYA